MDQVRALKRAMGITSNISANINEGPRIHNGTGSWELGSQRGGGGTGGGTTEKTKKRGKTGAAHRAREG
jgi:hypothetical protein